MKRTALLVPALLLSAQTSPQAKPVPSPNEIVGAASAAEWVAIAPADLLVMDLAVDRDPKERRVVIQLMPRGLTSAGHIGNVRLLAAARWWDATSINRVQDNYVVQWGDATEKKPLPSGLATITEDAYTVAESDLGRPRAALEKERPMGKLLGADRYAAYVDFEDGWPIASNLQASFWPIHCYGMVGVGRDMSPNTGTGAELYTVIGHAPRHLDRNIALIGRVIEGIEHLSSLPRGTGALGVYQKAEQRVPIASIRIATELPAAQRPRFQYLSTESATFARYADARANRRDPFFIRPAGGADICNIPVPVRRAP